MVLWVYLGLVFNVHPDGIIKGAQRRYASAAERLFSFYVNPL